MVYLSYQALIHEIRPCPVNTAKLFWPIGTKDRICGCKNQQVLYQLKAKSEAANT